MLALVVFCILFFDQKSSEVEVLEVGLKNDGETYKEMFHNISPSTAVEIQEGKPRLSIGDEKPECISLKEYLNSEDVKDVERIFNENNLSPSSVEDYLIALDESELILEAMSGNNEAYYVLGMNKHWSSHHTAKLNPTLNNISDLGVPKPLDLTTLKESRKYLWDASINGISIALLELASTFDTEVNHSDLSDEEVKILYENKYLYRRLFISVSPEVSEIYSLSMTRLNRDFDFLDLNDLEGVYGDLYNKWRDKRSSIGKGVKIEVSIPDYIKKSWDKKYKICN